MRLTLNSNRSRFYDPHTETIFFLGLDLGQVKDYTALTIIERPPGIPFKYNVRNLMRFPIGTSYPEVVNKLISVTGHPAVQPNLLVIDATGVGAPIADMFRQNNLYFIPVIITGADKVSRDQRAIRVPKRDLVSTLQILLQTKQLKIAGSLPEAQTLIEELLNFQIKISASGHDSYGAWREGAHDDLILATSLACWASEKRLLPKGLRNPRPSSGRKPLYVDNSATAHLLKKSSRFFDKNKTFRFTLFP